ncbi:sensor histidine kinase [Plantactinospora siamensis]|uniref:histidine kinase n=1 Tax=Plantactinospora siamensis TaxID=555372 RepID=A0ABV6NSB6_9ACTN
MSAQAGAADPYPVRSRRWLGPVSRVMGEPGGSWRSVFFDLMVAAMVALFALLSLGITQASSLKLIGFAMALAVLPRRRFPLSVMVVVSALALLQVLLFSPNHDPMPFDVAVLIAMYSVVKYAVPRWHAFVAAVPTAIGIVIEVVRHVRTTNQVIYTSLFLTAVCAGVWLMGYTVRTRRLFMASLQERALTAERERDQRALLAVVDERAAIARELHDVVAHSLSVMIVQADGASFALARDPELAGTAIRQVAATGREALEDMRRLVGVLRGSGTVDGPDDGPPISPAGGVGTGGAADGGSAASAAATALDGGSAGAGTAAADGGSAHGGSAHGGSADEPVRRRVGLVELPALLDRARSAGLRVDVEPVPAKLPDLPAGLELTLYRLVQEGLTNVLRHAGPGARVTLRLGYTGGGVSMELIDDGGGRVAAAPGRSGGHGLVGMRERVAVHGGSCEAGPVLGGGWRVSAILPSPGRSASDRPGPDRSGPDRQGPDRVARDGGAPEQAAEADGTARVEAGR